MAESKEYSIIVKCRRKLEIALESDRDIAQFLLQQGFIAQERYDEVINPKSNLTDADKASMLVTAISNRVELNPRNYYKVVDHLRQNTIRYGDIVEILDREYHQSTAVENPVTTQSVMATPIPPDTAPSPMRSLNESSKGATSMLATPSPPPVPNASPSLRSPCEGTTSTSSGSFSTSTTLSARSKVKPNAFISFRISSPEIKSNIEQVQQEMVKSVPQLKSSMTSQRKLVMSFMILKLATKEEEERAKQCLSEVTQMIHKKYSLGGKPLRLEIGGIGNFRDQVVFAQVKDGPAKDNLCRTANDVKKYFSLKGLPTTDKRKFHPHVTIANVKNALNRDKAYLENKIPSSSYDKFMETKFGMETAQGLDLLSMTTGGEDGYICLASYPFEH